MLLSENIAVRKNAWQLHPYQHREFGAILNASKAVDGMKSNLSYFALQCTQSGENQSIASWRVDLGAVLGIHHIIIYYRTDGKTWGKYLLFSLYIYILK